MYLGIMRTDPIIGNLSRNAKEVYDGEEKAGWAASGFLVPDIHRNRKSDLISLQQPTAE
jgi:hypothetical protein